MSLKPQEIEIPLNLGMETKPSDELQEPSSMRLVQNLHWRGLGELEKRPVYGVSHAIAEPSGSAYDEADACGLIVTGDRADIVTGKHGVQGYSELKSTGTWARRSTSGDPTATLRYCPVSYDLSRYFVEGAQFNKTDEGIATVTSAQYSGVLVLAWIMSGATNILKLKAVEADTGRVLCEESIVIATTGMWCRAVEYTESGKEGVLIAYIDDTSAPIVVKTVRWNHATSQFAGDSDLTTNAKTYVFTLAKNGNRVYFGFTDNTSGFLVVQDRTIGSITTTHTGTHGADNGVCIVAGTTRVLIGSSVAATAYAEVFGSPANAITVRAASSETFGTVAGAYEARVGGTDNAVLWILSDPSSAPSLAGTRVRSAEITFSTTTPVLGAESLIPQSAVVSDGFTLRGMAHVLIAPFLAQAVYPARTTACIVARYRGNNDGNTVRHDAVGKIGHDRFFLRALSALGSPQPVYVDSNNNAWIAMTADPSPDLIAGATWPQSIMVARLSAARPMPMPYAQPEPRVTMVAGALPWESDGVSPAEATPLCYPVALTDVSAGTGQTGTFDIIPVYRFVDKAGRVKLLPGAAVSTGAIINKQIDVYVSRCPLRAYDGYSSAEPDMEPELYISDGTTAPHYLANDASGYKHTYSGLTTDGNYYKFTAVRAGLSANAAYPFDASDEGTPISPESTPGFFHVSKVVDRILAVDTEDRSRIWPSKPIVPGFGVEWSINNTFTVADDCTAVIAQGGGIVVLARGGLYLVSGEGPNALNQGGFDPAVKIADIDCIDPASVCSTPIGVVFRGRRGFYLLNGTQAQPWGVPIDPEVLTDPALDPSISASYRMRVVHQEQTNEIHVGPVPGGDRLVYNLLEQKWSKYDGTGVELRDLAIARGKVWQLDRIAGVDVLRDDLLYSHSGVNYAGDADTTWRIETPWYRLDEVAGMVRLWRAWLNLAAGSGLGDVTLDYYVNNKAPVQQSVTWTAAELSAALVFDPSTSERVVNLPFVPMGELQVVKTFKFAISCVNTYVMKPLSLRLRFGMRPSLNKRNRLVAKG